MITGIGGAPVCDYNVDNLKWSGKAIMNSISLNLWESIDKYSGIRANGISTYAAIILKIQQVSSSEIRNIVDGLRKMSLIKESGQEVETLGSQVTKKTHCIVGFGSAPSDIASIVDQ